MNFDSNTLQQLRQLIGDCRTAVLTAHVNPDGDAVGSVLALWHWLQNRGIDAHVLLPNAAPSNLQWMPGAERMLTYSARHIDLIASADIVFVLDLNTVTRLGDLGQHIANSSARIVNIDHHTHPQDFAHIAFVDTESSSTCAMIADIIRELSGAESITPAIATCLYTGIMTDSGSFRFPRTTSKLFADVSVLVSKGADPVVCYEEVMNQSSFGRTKLLGAALASLTLHAEGKLCTMIVRRSDLLATSCSVDDVEGFVHHTLTIAGVRAGILFVEVDGEVKCSFRSKGEVFVRDLAALYGGGGHVHASGARIRRMPIDQVVRVVTDSALNLFTAPD